MLIIGADPNPTLLSTRDVKREMFAVSCNPFEVVKLQKKKTGMAHEAANG